MRKIYVASSWRNKFQQEYVMELRSRGHEVYDFKNPREGDTGFHWSSVGVNSTFETCDVFIKGLNNPIAAAGYFSDYEAMQWADTFILLLPCGKSAHLELGWAVGKSKHTIVHTPFEKIEPELMYKLADDITYSTLELLEVLR